MRRGSCRWRAEVTLFGVGVALYLVTRVIGLTRFPIYFFCDEAIQSTLADALVHHGLRGDDGTFLPPYFLNVDKWSLSLTVWLQVPVVAVLGTSILVTRLTFVVVGSLILVGLAVALRVLGVRTWWLSVFVLLAVPAWFLHSRTGFEVVVMVAAYACFLAAYLLYRYRSPTWAPGVVVLGAAVFYAYANGQGLMLLTAAGLLVSDARHHVATLRRPRVAVSAGATMLVCAVPYLRERLRHPSETEDHLRLLGSYWYDHVSLGEKLWTFLHTYARGLSPAYWFQPDNGLDLSRHTMKGMGHVWWPLLPFVVIGLVVCIRRWRSSGHRLVLIALVASPFSAAMVEVVVTRALVTVVPITLLACIGIDRALDLVRSPRSRMRLAAAVTAGLAALGIVTTALALDRGARWYDDYGLYGMQWGASQVFTEIRHRLDADPALQVVVASSWANNPNAFVPFFLPTAERGRVRFAAVGDYLLRRRQLDPSTLFVLTPEELALAQASPKLVVGAPEVVIPYPDGRSGFSFVRLAYTPGADAIFARELAERLRPVTEQLAIAGEPVTVRHSRLDIGSVAAMLDGDPFTLARGLEANPLVVELTWRASRPLRAVEVQVRSLHDATVTALVVTDDGSRVRRVVEAHDIPEESTIHVRLVDAAGEPLPARRLRLEIRDRSGKEDVHVHVREITLR